jgi:hypothetical protein
MVWRPVGRVRLGLRSGGLRREPVIFAGDSDPNRLSGTVSYTNIDFWRRPDRINGDPRSEVAPCLLIYPRQIRSESDRGKDHDTRVSLGMYGQCRRTLSGHTGISNRRFIPAMDRALRRSDLVPRVARRIHRDIRSVRVIRSPLLSQPATGNPRV